jgi:hypothetical protein
MDRSILDIEKQAARMQGIRDKCESIRWAADHTPKRPARPRRTWRGRRGG